MLRGGAWPHRSVWLAGMRPRAPRILCPLGQEERTHARMTARPLLLYLHAVRRRHLSILCALSCTYTNAPKYSWATVDRHKPCGLPEAILRLLGRSLFHRHVGYIIWAICVLAQCGDVGALLGNKEVFLEGRNCEWASLQRIGGWREKEMAGQADWGPFYLHSTILNSPGRWGSLSPSLANCCIAMAAPGRSTILAEDRAGMGGFDCPM
jgi:hypothetical protein